jgi:hypothetical protein
MHGASQPDTRPTADLVRQQGNSPQRAEGAQAIDFAGERDYRWRRRQPGKPAEYGKHVQGQLMVPQEEQCKRYATSQVGQRQDILAADPVGERTAQQRADDTENGHQTKRLSSGLG